MSDIFTSDISVAHLMENKDTF